MGKRKDLTGKRFGNWTVLGFSHTSKSRKLVWDCRCDCGREYKVIGNSLNQGDSTKCRECFQVHHGNSYTRMYQCWADMKARCLNPKHKSYSHYGGRGISICIPWLDFKSFYSDMIKSYQEHLTLERIDVNGNYCPENCTWVTKAEQNKNTTRTQRKERETL